MRFSEDAKMSWVPQGDDTYECQVLVCASLRPLRSLLQCLLTIHVDDRKQSNGVRESCGCEGIRNLRFVY